MKYWRIILLTISFLLINSVIYSQFNLTSVSFNLGSIRTNQIDYSLAKNHLYAFYPELKVGGSFIRKPYYWKVYCGYWNDKVTKPFPVMDSITYSSRSIILGGKIEFMITEKEKNRRLNVSPFLGLSKHYTKTKYIGGFDFGGNPGHNSSSTMTALDFGLNFNVSLYGPLGLIIEFQRFYQFYKLSEGIMWKRNAYKTGLFYNIR